jgi:hypothetical protein
MSATRTTPKVVMVDRQTILALLLLGAGVSGGFALDGARAEPQGNCGNQGVTVLYGDPAELDEACGALADIVAYFRGIGIEVTPRITLRFADRAIVRSAERASVHGYFDGQQAEITFYRKSQVRPWGLPWSSALADSFLRHELAHMAIWEAVRGGPVKLRPEWHEFIAYAVQLDLMDPQLRRYVLNANIDVRPSESLLEINEFTSRMDPDTFAVTAYKTYLAQGAGTFVSQLLRGEIVPPPFVYPFAVLPGQVPDR